jgi:protease-4
VKYLVKQKQFRIILFDEGDDNMKNKKWGFIIVFLIILGLISFIMAGILSLFVDNDFDSVSGNVALIPIKGVISNGEGGLMGDVVSSDEIINFLEKAESNPSVQAIILEINSPGGTPVASVEIADKVKEINKTTVAWIRDAGASGAYWIASATDHIVANQMSVTGSVGVIASHIEFAGFIERYNMSYRRFVGGEYKDLGDPLKRLSATERVMLQKKIDKMHDYFIEAVKENRDLEEWQVKEISSGIFYLGSEAMDVGLVDELGGEKEAVKFIETEINITADIAEYMRERSLFDVFASALNQNSFFVGKGIGTAFFEKTETSSRLDIWI